MTQTFTSFTSFTIHTHKVCEERKKLKDFKMYPVFLCVCFFFISEKKIISKSTSLEKQTQKHIDWMNLFRLLCSIDWDPWISKSIRVFFFRGQQRVEFSWLDWTLRIWIDWKKKKWTMLKPDEWMKKPRCSKTNELKNKKWTNFRWRDPICPNGRDELNRILPNTTKKKTLNDGWRSLPKWYIHRAYNDIYSSLSHTYIDDLKPITSLSFTDLLIFFLALFHSIHLFDRFFLSLIHSFIRFVGCHTI